jgi:type I restriction enzyme, S subunit
MALKTITVPFKELEEDDFIRLDCKYFFVKILFDRLSKNKDYEVKNLDDLKIKVSSGSYIDTYTSSDTGIKFLRVANIKPYNIDEQENSLVYVKKEVNDKIKVKENEIVLGRTQATIEKLGISSIVDDKIKGSAISQHVSKLTINPEILSPFYLISYLNSKFFKAQTALATHGDTRVELTHSQLKKVRVFIPAKKIIEDIENKTKIIIRSNRQSIDLIKEAQEILREKLELNKFKYRNDKFFSNKISKICDFGIWNARSHLPIYTETEEYIEDNFKCEKLGKIAKIKKGAEAGSDNYKTDLFKEKLDFAFIRTSDIINNEIDMYPDYYVSEIIAKGSKTNLIGGDIVFSKDGKVGEIAIASNHDRAMIASGFARIRLEEKETKFTSEYLFTVLSVKETGFYPAIRRTIIASTIPHLREERLKEINVPLIDDKSIEKITNLIKKAYELKDKKKKLILEVRKEIDGFFDF